MSTIANASLMVELQQDGYTSKTREVSQIFEGNRRAIPFARLGVNHYLVVLYFPASACQSHPMYRQGLGNVYYSKCITHGGVTTRWLHLEDERIPHFFRETEPFHSHVWVSTTTLLCSIFLPVLVKAIPCIGKDLGMSTIANASLMVELQQDGYTSKTREVSQIFEGNRRAIPFARLGVNHYLVVLYFPASACQSHPMYRQGLGNVYYSKCITHGGVTTRWLHLEDERIPHFFRETEPFHSHVWVSTTTLLCSIFLPVLVKAIPCIGKDLGMSTIANASLMVELQQDGYTSKTREVSQIFEGNRRAIPFARLGVNHYLVVLYFPASACQSHPMYRQGLGNVYYSKCITHGGVTTRWLHLEDERIPHFFRETEPFHSHVWVSTTTLLCSIFLPVLVKAIPCIGKDLGMSTIANESLMVELQQDGYTSKTRESRLFEGNQAERFGCLGVARCLVVLYFPANACQSHPMYR